MSWFLLLAAWTVAAGWFYDESKFSVEARGVGVLILLGLAFIAWCVEHIAEAIKEKNSK